MAYEDSLQKVFIANDSIFAVLSSTSKIQAVLDPVPIIPEANNTFVKLIANTRSTKIFLAEIEPSERLTSWTLYSGSIYYTDIDVIDVTGVKEDGVIFGEVNSISAITAGKWYHGKNKIYLQSISGTPFLNVIVASYKLYYATKNIVLNDIFYEGILSRIPVIKQKKAEIYWGVSIISSGSISLSGIFDDEYKNYSWNNKNITIFLGGDDLPYSEYTKQFGGIITNISYRTNKLDIDYEDKKTELEDTIPKNAFNTTDYPNLDSEDVGKPIPLIYGTVFKVPMVCNTLALGTATSLHSFKILDTSVCSVNTISQVYVNDVAVTHLSGSISDASFKLATSTYSPGDSVTVSIIATESNPVEQIKSIASNVISIPYNSDNYNTTAIVAAVTEVEPYPCGIALTEYISFLELIGDLMKSCMGSFFNDNEGKYSIKIWDTEIGEDLSAVDFNDIITGSFSSISKVEDIRKIIRLGWNRNWGANTYSYKQLSSDITEPVYGITKTKTIPTLQSTSAGIDILLGRLGLIFETETIRIKFKSKIQLADKNIGDRIQISFKRQAADDNFSWIDSAPVEINTINKDFINNIFTVECDDLKGVGQSVGLWTGDTPVFPASLGGGSIAIWDDEWSETQKNYARQNSGFWTDDDGFADPDDSDSLNNSKWW